MKDLRIYFFLSVLVFSCCSKSEIEKYQAFPKKKAQHVTERVTRSLTPVDSLNVAKAFESQSLSDVDLTETSVITRLNDQIVKLNKQDLSTENVFKMPKGRGPGEVINFNVTMFEVGNEMIAIHDGKAKKTMLYDLNGNFQEEFLNGGYQASNMAMADDQTYYFEVMPNHEYLFFEVRRTKSKSKVRHRFQKQTDDVNALAYTGEIVYHGNSLYYGGYTEPMIRRYDLSGEKAELVFSRAIIDDYNSENNYQQPKKVSGGRYFGYTDEAKYAIEDLAVDDTYLYSVRHHNGEKGYKYLDIYAVEDGNYQGSYTLKHYPFYIAVDEQYVYTVEASGDVRYLMKYEKPEMDF